MAYADIIIDLSLEKLDHTYQYVIPAELEKKAVIGARVTVPFGNGGRTITGCIIGISSQPKIEPERIKPILEVPEGAMAVEGELIRLAWWIRETYGSTMNEALKTVLPVKKKVRTQKKRYVRLLLSKEDAKNWLCEFERKKHRAKVRLLSELMETEVLDYRLVTGKLNIPSQTLKGLVKQGFLTIEGETVYRNPIGIDTKTTSDCVELNAEQQYAVDVLCHDLEQGRNDTYLLFGVTGSGKTEVYLSVIEKVVSMGKQAIVLIPEIALTYQTVKRFYRRFGERVSILNSRMSQGERYDQYLRAKDGNIDIIIGPRSALFTPFQRLGLIIMDEEHEGSYKSEHPPKYHARETAQERARLCGASLLLGSATPSAESYYRAQMGEYKMLLLNHRAGSAVLPKVYVEDLREELKQKNYSIFSRRLQKLIGDRLEKKEQIMLFLNRRGYAGFISCRSCGYVAKCPHCDVSLKYHRDRGNTSLVCHYCGFQSAVPERCPECGSDYIGTFGIGTQQVEELVKKQFPEAAVLRMDTDTTSKKDSHSRILSAFSNHEADILIGTQMIVKGHDFKDVTLVGILAADMSMYTNDYRAAERTFQLLCQAAGRAGRGMRPGEVVIQTYHPEEPCITMAASQNYEDFIQHELAFRQMMGYPPVACVLALLVLSGQEDKSIWLAELLVQAARGKYAVPLAENRLAVLGPAPASVAKINDVYRQVIYIKCGDQALLRRVKTYLENCLDHLGEQKATVQFDWEPMGNY